MCAIFGVLGSYEKKKITEAVALLRHRGPDESEILFRPDCAVAHNRLAIVDKAHKLAIEDPHGVILSFNGEIYNYKALRAQLCDYAFQSEGDSEVILAAYHRWGEAFIEKIEGMFAIAILDHGKLLLFRDRLGKKPLFYFQDESRFIFASELKAIKLMREENPLNTEAIRTYLGFQTLLYDETFFQDIASVEAGEKVVYEAGAIRRAFYDDILPEKIELFDEKAAIATIKTALIESIEKRRQCEVPVGYLLSGGLDSSLICALAQEKSAQPIETFTIGYAEYERYDESAYAQEVADHIGAHHHKIIYTYEDFKADIDAVLYYLDQPLNDPAALPLFHLFRTMKEKHGVTVAISGEGSDELFMGYRPYREFLDIEQLADLGKKSWLKNYFKAHPSEHREWEWYRRIFDEEVLFRGSAESFTDRHIKGLVKQAIGTRNSAEVIQKYRDRFIASGMIEPSVWYRYLDLKINQGCYFLTKLDRMSMAHSIEARAPYLDENLVKRSFKIDPKLFLKEDRTKYLLKEAARGSLPDAIIDRKKRGFSYPFIEWLDRMGALDEMIEINKKLRLFYPKSLQRLVDGAKRGQFKQHVYGLYMLLRFLEKEYNNLTHKKG